jgi:ABC-type dipeptide/oligopeptide/nickel transport system permease component
MGMVMVTAITVIIGNLLADTVNALLDPRIRID